MIALALRLPIKVVDPPAAEWYRDNWCEGTACAIQGTGDPITTWESRLEALSRIRHPWYFHRAPDSLRNLGADHELFLIEQGSPGEFIRNPVPTKAMWETVQDFHPKTLACTLLVEGSGGQGLVAAFDKINANILLSGLEKAALHLKIEAWHEAMTQTDESPSILIGAFRTILMPRLKRLDQDHSRTVADVRHRWANEYHHVILLDRIQPVHTIFDVLDIYERFRVLTRATTLVTRSCEMLVRRVQ